MNLERHAVRIREVTLADAEVLADLIAPFNGPRVRAKRAMEQGPLLQGLSDRLDPQ